MLARDRSPFDPVPTTSTESAAPLIVGFDGSTSAIAAVTWAATSGAPIIVIRVLEPRPAGAERSHGDPTAGGSPAAPHPARRHSRLMGRHGSAGAVVIDRCKDARRQLGRATTIDQLEQCVKVDRAVAGEPSSQVGGAARADQAAATPLDDLHRRRSFSRGRVEGHARVSARPVARLTPERATRKTSKLHHANRA